MKTRGFYLLLLLIGVGLFFSACGNSSGNPAALHGTYSYFGTQSPGDVWNWTLGEGTIVATNETLGFYYSGTFSALASGFLKGVIAATNDPTVPANGSFYMLELPNSMLIVKPGGNSDRMIVCAARTVLPPTAGQYNWIKVPGLGWDNGTAFGTADVTVSSGSIDIAMNKYDIAGSLRETTNEAGFTFVDGKISREGSALQVFMTPSGLFFGDNGPGSGGFFGTYTGPLRVPTPYARNYRGVIFSYDSQTRLGVTKAIGVGPHPTRQETFQGWSYSDVDANTVDPSSYVAITLEASGIPRVWNGIMIDEQGQAKEFKMIYNYIGGKYVMLGITAMTNTRPENFVIVEQ